MFKTGEPQSFKINLPELHVSVVVLFLHDLPYDKQLIKVYEDLERLEVDEDTQSLVNTVNRNIGDCAVNPGFCFSYDDTTVFVCFKVAAFKDDKLEYFINIMTHELTHAAAFIFQNLGLDRTDDEHLAIVQGNMAEECVAHIKEFLDSDDSEIDLAIQKTLERS